VFRAKRRTVVSVAAVAVALLAGALVITFTQGTGQAANPNLVVYQVGHRPKAPDFTATSLTGTPISFSSYRGKVTVVNFWGSWCDPCRREAPTLAVVAEQYKSRGVSFLGVDVSDSTASAQAFIRKEGISYPSVFDSGYVVTGDFGRVVLVSATPTTIVVDRTGHIAGLIYGSTTYSELTGLLSDAGVTT